MLSMISMMQKTLPNFLEEGKEWGGNPSSFLVFKKRKEESFGSFLNYYAFGMIRESSLILKWSLISTNGL